MLTSRTVISGLASRLLTVQCCHFKASMAHWLFPRGKLRGNQTAAALPSTEGLRHLS